LLILCNKSITHYGGITTGLHQIDHLVACSNFDFCAVKTKMFSASTIYFKDTLMLVADADDARSAQDKIYEWKIALIN
jgi:hypothetical protein